MDVPETFVVVPPDRNVVGDDVALQMVGPDGGVLANVHAAPAPKSRDSGREWVLAPNGGPPLFVRPAAQTWRSWALYDETGDVVADTLVVLGKLPALEWQFLEPNGNPRHRWRRHPHDLESPDVFMETMHAKVKLRPWRVGPVWARRRRIVVSDQPLVLHPSIEHVRPPGEGLPDSGAPGPYWLHEFTLTDECPPELRSSIPLLAVAGYVVAARHRRALLESMSKDDLYEMALELDADVDDGFADVDFDVDGDFEDD